MLNPIAVSNHFQNLPSGFDQSCLRQHVTVIIALAAGSKAQLPPADVPREQLKGYFFDNLGPWQGVMYEINEVIPFEVDRAQQLAYKIFERRYDIAYNCCAMDLLHGDKMFGDVFRNAVPEFDNLCIDSGKIVETIHLFESQFEKAAA